MTAAEPIDGEVAECRHCHKVILYGAAGWLHSNGYAECGYQSVI
jgi:hypothetical protein